MRNAKTLVIGASIKPDRYGNIVIHHLRKYQQAVVAFGVKAGVVLDVEIQTDWAVIEGQDIDTVTLYLSAANQSPYYDKILALQPRRVIFNPGTENPAFMRMLEKEGIQPIEACTLVMLSIGQF